MTAQQVERSSILTDYFPTVLAQEIRAAAFIKPIITALNDNTVYILKNTGEVVIRNEHNEYVPITDLPRIIHISWYTDMLLMITIDSKAIWIRSVVLNEAPELIPGLEKYDITQITVRHGLFYLLTVTGRLLQLAVHGRVLQTMHINIVQIKFGLALDSDGRIIDTTEIDPYTQTDEVVVDILGYQHFVTLNNTLLRLTDTWKKEKNLADIVQFVDEANNNWKFYLTKKGKIFIDKPSNVIPNLNNIGSFDLLDDILIAIDVENNIHTIKYTTRKRLFMELVPVADESIDE